MPKFYELFCNDRGYDENSKKCIENTVSNLQRQETNVKKPGMLLGKIQSGKTRMYIGIIALSFDKGYDMAIILTKGTKALAEQTYKRLDMDFETLIEEDYVKLYDIMYLPEELTAYVRNKKLIIIVKKQKDNLNHLVDLFNRYPDLKTKKLLIIDDEADYASVGFRRNTKKLDDVSINIIADKVNKLRDYGVKCDFLQVTATPYSLYLQPETVQLNGEVYNPIRPVFTELVPIHDKYIGSEFYFEESEIQDSIPSCLHIDVPEKELGVLGQIDQRYIHNIGTTPNLQIFRNFITNFIVGGVIRRIQEHPRNYKCSFIMHIEKSKEKHEWQIALTKAFINKLQSFARVDENCLKKEVLQSISDLQQSSFENTKLDKSHIYNEVKKTLLEGYIGISKINSDQEITSLLDKKGQLRLENPFNIFIGGQILDRGITVENLIGFFYGRNPRNFQLDTVLQHSRMYGARSKKDLCVTRFYTSARIYDAMKKMHFIDSSLRKAFEKGEHEDGVVFLLRDETGQVKHCAPNKILISSTETIRPFRRLLPRGMQTGTKTAILKTNNEIEKILNHYHKDRDPNEPFLIDSKDAEIILKKISSTYLYEDHYENVNYKWDVLTTIAVIKKLTTGLKDSSLESKLYCVVKKNRNSSRKKMNGAFYDAPDDGKIDIPLAKKVAKKIPCLQLFYQNGRKENGWRDAPFWWPVLMCPENIKTHVFASKTI